MASIVRLDPDENGQLDTPEYCLLRPVHQGCHPPIAFGLTTLDLRALSVTESPMPETVKLEV